MPILRRWASRRRRATEHGRGSTLDRPPGPRLRRQAPDPEYRQRPEERFNFSGFTGALER
jgi:hypothetical protein